MESSHPATGRRSRLFLLGGLLVLPGALFLALVAAYWPPIIGLIADPVLASAIVIVCSILGFMGIMILVLALVGRIQESPLAVRTGGQEES